MGQTSTRRGTPTSLSNIYDLIERMPSHGQFHKLSEATFLVPPPPRFFFGNFPAQIARRFFSHIGLGAVGTFRLRDIQFHAAYLMAQGSECVICAELNIHPQHITDALVSLEGLQRPIRRIEGRAAFVLGPGHSIFGHWLVDFLPKLQVLTESGYDISRLSYLVPKSTPSWGMELFGLVGIRQDQLIIFDHDSEVVEMEELLLPTFLHNGVRFAPIFRESVASLKRSILTGSESMSSIAKSKIYISRAKASQTRPFQNGSSAEAIAEDYGFAICHPEKLDIRDQIVLFASAACIIGEYGSAHHLSIFAPPGAVVCGWRGSEYHPGFIQSGVGCALSQPTGYVFGETDTSDGRGAYFIADQTIRDCLDTVFRGHFFE